MATTNGTSGNDTLNGTTVADTLNGLGGDDVLSGLEGNDTLRGGTGNDFLDGGDGEDAASYLTASGAVTVNLRDGIATGGDGSDSLTQIENVIGSAFGDFIAGSTADNDLNGGDGNDRIYGSLGNDQLHGGNGDDWLSEQWYSGEGVGDDVYDGGAGNDRVYLYSAWGGAGVTVDLRLDGVAQDTGGAGVDTFIGVEHVITNFMGGDDTLIGNDVGNWFTSYSGSDQLWGNGGDDLFSVTVGTKTIDGGLGSDTVQISELPTQSGQPVGVTLTLELLGQSQSTAGMTLTLTDVENLEGYLGADQLTGDGNANILAGNAGNDTLTGGAGDDVLAGDGGFTQYGSESGAIEFFGSLSNVSGSDLLVGGLGNDTLIGGGGSDTASYAAASGSVQINLGSGTATGADGNDTLSGIERIIGSAFNDTIMGSSTSNVLDGGTGADSMSGANGNDTYVVDNAGDTVTEASVTGGTDLVQSSVTFTLGTNVENLTLTGAADVRGNGNGADNVLVGNGGVNTLVGYDGNDTYVVNTVGDRAVETSAAGGYDWVQSSVSYILGSNIEKLTLTGTAANGTGNDLANLIIGNSSDNLVDGRAGADDMQGGMGNDTYVVDNIGDVITETSYVADVNTVKSSVSYALGAYLDNLTLTGTSAINGTGNEYSNLIIGNAGANVIDGGWGGDVMKGYGGNDTYIVDNAFDKIGETSTGGIDTVMSSIGFILASYIENLTLTGTAEINATGNSVANHLTGNSAANWLDGRGGADVLEGGAGDDTYFVDQAGDAVTEEAGNGTDTVRSTVSWSLGDNLENLLLTGTLSANGTGNALDNRLTGNANANVLDGGLGADLLIGGGGNDTYVVDNAGDSVSESSTGGIDTVKSSVSYSIYGTYAENLTLIGTDAINAQGSDADNILIGNSAANELNGNYGADTMKGGGGDDTYWVHDAGDVIVETSSAGVDTVNSAISLTLGTNVENLTLIGGDPINATGNSLQNVITGNSFANVIDGGAGADTLIGGGGLDTFIVDNAGDTVAGSGLALASVSYTLTAGFAGDLTLTGTASINGAGNDANNVITGNEGANVLSGNGGDDTLSGGAGADTLNGGNEHDVLDGGTGADVMRGGSGDDTYMVDNAGDQIVEVSEGYNLDIVVSSVSFTLANEVENLVLTGTGALNGTGNSSDNVIFGNDGANLLSGNAGSDYLGGGAGNDQLSGGDGDDILIGGSGSDTLQGGAGVDLFGFDEALGASNVDSITDFSVVDDFIVLSSAIFSSLTSGDLPASAFQLGTTANDQFDRIIYDKATGNIYYDADGNGAGVRVQFAKVTAGTSLTAANFYVEGDAQASAARVEKADPLEIESHEAPDVLIHGHSAFDLDSYFPLSPSPDILF